MPINPVLAAGITAGGSVLSQGINAITGGALNQKSQRWQEKMFNWQNNTNLTNWGLENAYNHPSEQMKRLRESGLNPNLVYGNGATAQGGDIGKASAGSWNPQAPQVDLGGAASQGFGAYFDAQIKQATADNLRETLKVIQQEGILKAAQVMGTLATAGKTGVETDLHKVDLKYAEQLKQQSLQVAQAGIQKTQADTQYTLDENERKAAMQAPNLIIAVETILNMRLSRAKTDAEISHIKQMIENAKQDYRLKQFDEYLQSTGVPRTSPAWMKVVGQAIDDLIGGSSFKGTGVGGANKQKTAVAVGKAFQKK